MIVIFFQFKINLKNLNIIVTFNNFQKVLKYFENVTSPPFVIN